MGESGDTGVVRDFAGPAAAAGAAVIGYRDLAGTGFDLLVAGTTALTAVIEFGGQGLIVEDAAGRTASNGFVVGLPMAPMRVHGSRAECIEIRLSPLRAHALGIAAADLGGGPIAVEDLWGSGVRRLREQLGAAQAWDERFALTRAFLAQCDRSMRPPDPEVIAGWNRLLASGGRLRIGELADSLGWSRKRLWARFESQLGLNPKRAAMLVRFRCAVDGLLAGLPPAEVAATCGYTDQAHLARDVSLFGDRTPGALRGQYLPALAQDRYRAWGTFFQYRG